MDNKEKEIKHSFLFGHSKNFLKNDKVIFMIKSQRKNFDEFLEELKKRNLIDNNSSNEKKWINLKLSKVIFDYLMQINTIFNSYGSQNADFKIYESIQSYILKHSNDNEKLKNYLNTKSKKNENWPKIIYEVLLDAKEDNYLIFKTEEIYVLYAEQSKISEFFLRKIKEKYKDTFVKVKTWKKNVDNDSGNQKLEIKNNNFANKIIDKINDENTKIIFLIPNRILTEGLAVEFGICLGLIANKENIANDKVLFINIFTSTEINDEILNNMVNKNLYKKDDYKFWSDKTYQEKVKSNRLNSLNYINSIGITNNIDVFPYLINDDKTLLISDLLGNEIDENDLENAIKTVIIPGFTDTANLNQKKQWYSTLKKYFDENCKNAFEKEIKTALDKIDKKLFMNNKQKLNSISIQEKK